MTALAQLKPDPALDLVLERVVDVPPELVWAAWTTREHLMKWFVPAPWSLADCEIDPRPGGIFRTVIRSPEGEEFPGTGCVLEAIANERLTWTSALLPGFRPVETESFAFTAVITMEPHANGTRYTATAIHKDEAGRKKHDEMGFLDGWGKALDQLVALAKTL